MVVQLPSQVLGAAVGVLFYSTVCLLCSCLMIWLVWTHHERDSYVALLSYFTLLSTAASIAQQIHTLLWWMDIKVEQYEHVVANIGKPEIAIAGPSAGVDLVLFYIQYYSYNVEAMLTLFWACALCQSVFHVANTDILKRMKYKGHLFAKGVAIAVPVLLLSLLRLDVVQKSLPAFLVLANLNVIMSLPLGCIILLVILLKYIHTKRQLLSWHVRYPNRREPDEPEQGRICGPEGLEQYQGIYDRWLVLRFTIAFVVLGVFQVTTILSEVGQWENHTREALGDEADLSTARATKDFIFFIPGVSISLLVRGSKIFYKNLILTF
ncbi:hypothetical protein F4778DRAFT_493267 [Xylariomycetidae sp. FL2044]|nr:hypothetical protein F4778DRAFT_493267 [Xylariomycetidae sp. FL2044]